MAKVVKKSVDASALSGKVFPVAILAGPDQYLRRDTLASLAEDFLGTAKPGLALVRMEASLPMAAILDECRTVGMFSDKKIVLIEPADGLFKGGEDGAPRAAGARAGNREILEQYVQHPSDSALLVLAFDAWLKTTRLHKLLQLKGAIYECLPPKPHSLPAFITKRAREEHQKTISPQAALQLAELVGPDMARLDNELAKLALYRPDQPDITPESIDALVGFQHEREVWDLVNALAARDAAAALKKIDELFALDPTMGYSGLPAVFFFVQQALKARDSLDRGVSEGQITRGIWPPERGTRAVALAKHWRLTGAADIAAAMLNADMANKTSVGEARSNLEKFVVTFCTL